MIRPNVAQTTAAVAAHYDQLDRYYREIWGDHVHHGYWATGNESARQAVEALVDLVAERLDLHPGQQLCDIGCGYGATAQYLASRHDLHVTGMTVSEAQAIQARTRVAASGGVTVHVKDWLANGLPEKNFDRAYAIESSEHMPDKQRFAPGWPATIRAPGRSGTCWSRSAARAGCQRWATRRIISHWREAPALKSSASRTSPAASAGPGGFAPSGQSSGFSPSPAM
jgi:tocopherol O-methyltransferase